MGATAICSDFDSQKYEIIKSGVWNIEYPILGSYFCYAAQALGQDCFLLDKNSLLGEHLLTNQELEVLVYQNSMSCFSGILGLCDSHKNWADNFLVVELTKIITRENFAHSSEFLKIRT